MPAALASAQRAQLSWALQWVFDVPDSDDELTDAQQLALNIVRRIGRLVRTAAVFSVGVILIRAGGQGRLSVGGNELSISGAWPLLIFVAFTAAHVYWAWYALDKMSEVGEQMDAQRRGRQLLRRVQTDAGWFLGGLMPRTDRIRPNSRVVRMDLRDPTTLISCGIALVVLVACLPWTVTKQGFALTGGATSAIVCAIAALAVVAVNWNAATTWIVTLSQLGLPPEQQWALNEGRALISAPVPQWLTSMTSMTFWAVVAAVVLIPLIVIFAR